MTLEGGYQATGPGTHETLIRRWIRWVEINIGNIFFFFFLTKNYQNKINFFSARDSSKNRDSSTKKTKPSKQVNPLYVDLAYVPHHGNPYYTNVEFFKRIRARYYVFSGTDPNKDVFNALLEGKKSWENQDLGRSWGLIWNNPK